MAPHTPHQENHAATDAYTPSRMFLGGVVFYLTAWTIHTADHVRRGIFEPDLSVQILGNLQILLTLWFAWSVWKRHPIAPIAAIGIGVPVTIGIGFAHLAPDLGFVSDSLWVDGIDTFTWFAVLLEITGSAVLALVGWLEWRRVDYAVPDLGVISRRSA